MPNEKKYMQTLSQCIQDLEKDGFITSFKITDKGLMSLSTQKMFEPIGIKILHYYRFEGESNPDDNSIAYAIETESGEKGVLINGYGISSDPTLDNFIQQIIEIHK